MTEKPQMPAGGGRYARDDKGALKQVQAPTKPAAQAKPAAKAAAKAASSPTKKEG